MMGQSVLLDLEDGNGTNNDDNDFDDNHDEYRLPGDEVYVYAYTGTWTADWPHNHFTQFLGDHHRFYHYLHRQYTVHYHFFPLYNKTSSSLVSCFVFPSEIRFLP